MMRAIRAQSALLGIVLLFGLVAVGSIGVLLVGGQSVSEVEYQAEQERIEQSFVELSHRMATVARTGYMPRELDFEAGESGAVRKSDAGWITIEADGVSENLSMGAIEYVGDDGSIVAYQSGGVWRETGNRTQMLSAPPVHYDASDETLTLPVINMVEGEEDLTTGDVTISHESTDPVRSANVVEDDTVEVTIQSDYYRGWEQYFRTQAGDTAVQAVDHENRTVEILLGYLDIENAFDNGITYSEFYDGFDQSDVNGSIQPGSMPEMDPVIEDMVSDLHPSVDADVEDLGVVDYERTGANRLTNGTYYADEIETDGLLEFDLRDGDATLIVDGDIATDGNSIIVDEWDDDHELQIYSTGDLSIRGDAFCVDSCADDTSARRIQVYGTSKMGIDIGTGGTRFEGLLYAASNEDEWEDRAGQCDDDVQVCIQSNVDVYGSIVAASIDVHSGAVDMEYDSDLQSADIDVYPDAYVLPPQITYLNLAVYEMNVDNE